MTIFEWRCFFFFFFCKTYKNFFFFLNHIPILRDSRGKIVLVTHTKFNYYYGINDDKNPKQLGIHLPIPKIIPWMAYFKLPNIWSYS